MASNHHRHQVLLIDDDEDTRGGVAELMRMDGCEVLEAADGAEALAMLRTGWRPCVMLLDLNMIGPAAINGPTPGMASVPTPANQPRTPPSIPPVAAPVVAPSGAFVCCS